MTVSSVGIFGLSSRDEVYWRKDYVASMKEFIILSSSGFTQNEHGEDVENLQVIGWSKGASKEEAVLSFKEDQKELAQGFSKISAQETIS